MRKLFVLFISTCLISCSDFGVDIEVKNVSESVIDSVIVTNGYDKVKFEKLGKNFASSKFLTFSRKVKYDGDYGIRIFRKDEVKSYHFGYYSNGVPINGSYSISVQNDTIKVIEIAD